MCLLVCSMMHSKCSTSSVFLHRLDESTFVVSVCASVPSQWSAARMSTEKTFVIRSPSLKERSKRIRNYHSLVTWANMAIVGGKLLTRSVRLTSFCTAWKRKMSADVRLLFPLSTRGVFSFIFLLSFFARDVHVMEKRIFPRRIAVERQAGRTFFFFQWK